MRIGAAGDRHQHKTHMKLEILIVEDDALVRSTMRDAMAEAGHRVEAVADGEAAIASLGVARFDVVVSDVRLPRQGGLSVARAARQAPTRCGVILITAHGDVSEAVEALKAGVDDYMLKPFDMAEMMIRVERLGERILLTRELREARAQLAETSQSGRL